MPLRKINLRAEPPTEQLQSTQRDLDRLTADQIYEQVSLNGRRELNRTNISLAISGLAGGLTMGLTGLSVSIVTASLAPAAAYDAGVHAHQAAEPLHAARPSVIPQMGHPSRARGRR